MAPGFACRVRQRSNELLISVVRTKGGTEWSVTITFSWSAAMQQQTRAGDKLRCSDQSWNSSCLNCYIVSFVHPQCILCWRALCALLLLWEDNWEAGYTLCTSDWRYTRILSIKLNLLYYTSEAMKPLGQQRDTSTSYGWTEASGSLCDIKRECVSSSINTGWYTDNTILPAFTSRVRKKKSFVVDTVLTWSILNSYKKVVSIWILFSLPVNKNNSMWVQVWC